MASPSSPGLFTKTCDRFFTGEQQATLGRFFNAIDDAVQEYNRTNGPLRHFSDCSCSKCATSTAAKEEYYNRNNSSSDADDESNYQVRGSEADDDDDGLCDRDYYDEDAGEACIRSTSSCWPEPLQPRHAPIPAAGEYADLAATSPYDAEFEQSLREVEAALETAAAHNPTIADRRGKPALSLELVPTRAMLAAYHEVNGYYHAKPDASRAAPAALPKSKRHQQVKAAEAELCHLAPTSRAKALQEHLRRMNREKPHDGLDGESIARWVLMVDLPGEGGNNDEDEHIKVEEEGEEGYAYEYDYARYHDPSSSCVPAPLFSPAGGDGQKRE